MDDGSKKALGIGGGVAAFLAALWGAEPEVVNQFLSETAQSQIAQAGFFFTLAAWLHAGRVKKEIGRNFSLLTSAIHGATAVLRKDLDSHAKLLAEYGGRLDNLEKPK